MRLPFTIAPYSIAPYSIAPAFIAMLLMLSGSLVLAGCASGPERAASTGAQCPQDRSTGGMFCADIVRYARDPDSGHCCRYESLCASPPGWKTYTRKSACEAAGETSE